MLCDFELQNEKNSVRFDVIDDVFDEPSDRS